MPGILGLCPQNHIIEHFKAKRNQKKREIKRFREANDYIFLGENDHSKEIRSTLPQVMAKFLSIQNKFSIDLKNHKLVFGAALDVSNLQFYENFEVNVAGEYDSDHWALNFQAITLGNTRIETETEQVILDSGCTLHQANANFINQLISTLQRDLGFLNCV